MNHSWLVIVNPTAGQKRFSSLWNKTEILFKKYSLDVTAVFTEYPSHEEELVAKAIQEGYCNIISFGGDGTLHHVVNGIMQQRYTNTFDITLGVIPVGTGNDWIKTYKIPNSLEKAIKIIAEKNTIYQDIGKISIGRKTFYFSNVAGIGYDGYVVSKLKRLKRLGGISYLVSGLQGLLFYKKPILHIQTSSDSYQLKSLMVVIGLCRYSGGGMQLTKDPDPSDGLFDITIVPHIKFFPLVASLQRLYNGTIVNYFNVKNLKSKEVSIECMSDHNPFIQADGEMLGEKALKAEVISKALQFCIPKC